MNKFLALILALALPITVAAADTQYFRYDTSTRSWNPVKLIDNGDGTFSEQVSIVGGVVGATGAYKLISKESTSAPDSITFNGDATSWAFEVRGGSATFTVAGGSVTSVVSGVIGSDFNPIATDPVMSMISLEAGATAQMIIDGGQ